MVLPIVIKFGGSLLENRATRTVFLALLAQEWRIQQDLAVAKERSKIILVHGGGKDISRALESKEISPKFINGRRFTDQATMRVVEEVLQKINQEIVSQLENEHARAWGGCGKYEELMRAHPLPDLGLVGIPSTVNKTVLFKILNAIELPVFYSVALGPSNESLNINADDFAQEIAIACSAQQLIFMTDTGGINDKSGHLIEFMTPNDVKNLIGDGTISGGMAVKAQACVDALQRGVRKVTIAHQIDSLGSASPPRAFGTSFFPQPLIRNE